MNTKSLTYVMRGQDYKMTYSSKMKQVNVYEKQNKQTNKTIIIKEKPHKTKQTNKQ